MKLIDVDSKATLEDFLTLKKTKLVQRGNIMATTFSGGRSWSTRREPPTMGKQLVSFISCNLQSLSRMDNCLSNYHTIVDLTAMH
jgi:hypothetical protein